MNKTFLKRAGRRNKHHILSRNRGGKRTEANLLLMDENRHAAYHLLFGEMTLKEAGLLLLRTHVMKLRRML